MSFPLLPIQSASFVGDDATFFEMTIPEVSARVPTSTSSLEEAEVAERAPDEAVIMAEVDCVEIAGVVLIAVCEVAGGADEDEEEEGVTGSLLLLLPAAAAPPPPPGEVSTPSASSLLFLF